MMRRQRRNIGLMRHVMTLNEIVRSSDSGGGHERQDRFISNIRAAVEPLNAKEIARYQQLEQEITHKVETRYRADIAQGMRLDWDGRQLYVKSVVDPDARKEWLVLMCREGGEL